MIVLCYHAVTDANWPTQLAVTPEALTRQVGRLLRKGLVGRTFSAAVAEPDRRTFAVTFDDAYASVPERAFAVLSRLGVPGTVFVPTAHAGNGGLMAWPGTENWIGTEWQGELRAATWDQLRELAAAGWEIGSHSHTHPHLTSLSDSELAVEMAESRRVCEQQIGAPCTSIAYPYGDTDERVAAASRSAGYACGGALDSRAEAAPDRLRWPRLGAYARDTQARLAFKVWLFNRPALWNGLQAAGRRLRRPAGR